MARTEEDAIGTVEVPDEAYYGAFTQRAQDNFRLTGDRMPAVFIRAFGRIKYAAAAANNSLDRLDDETADAIMNAADEVCDGEFDDAFVLDMLQAGAGTPFHMNVNEVVANRATELLGGEKGEYVVDPHDDVNMGQSSNNVVPTAIRLATLELTEQLVDELKRLQAAFEEKAAEFDDVVKVGRTHLQDAVPITLGQEFAAYATMIGDGIDRIDAAGKELHVVGLGGNAVGTGINTPEQFRETVVNELSEVSDRELVPADDPVAMTRSMAPFAAYAGAVEAVVGDLLQLADDLVVLNSGPAAGLHELELPAVEEGSSIMPGKVNPNIVEAFTMSCLQVAGNFAIVRDAASAGDLELNVMTPLIAKNLFDSLELLINAVEMFREDCVSGIAADEDRIQDLFEGSSVTATALAPYLGYDEVARVVQTAVADDRSIRDVVVDEELMTEQELDVVLDPDRLTGPHSIDEELRDTVRERRSD